MISHSISRRAVDVILQDAIQRDITTARRSTFLQILWNERYLTRAQLIARVEYRLGRNCFGTSAREDTFYRDMRVVKQAFQADGYILEYSRNKELTGYYLQGQPALSPEFKQLVRASVAEVDWRQIDIYRRLPATARFRQGSAISDAARNVVAYRIRQEHPELTMLEANRMALRSGGFETEVISDGGAALNRLAGTPPAVIMLDMHLPHVAGTTILQTIRADARFARTSVIVATADARLAGELQDQADLILLKPISVEQVREFAKRLLQRWNTTDASAV
jgi:CheY-like chemotaxis protein